MNIEDGDMQYTAKHDVTTISDVYRRRINIPSETNVSVYLVLSISVNGLFNCVSFTCNPTRDPFILVSFFFCTHSSILLGVY
jgi:hypothetical protein